MRTYSICTYVVTVIAMNIITQLEIFSSVCGVSQV